MKDEFKKIVYLLIAIFCFSNCNSQSDKRIAKIYMETHIAMPKENRDIGYDSIQLLVNSDGKIWANFCYPNGLRFKKDTVYTSDSSYKKWFNVFQLAPNIILSTNNGFVTMFSNGYIDMRKGYFDSLTVDSFQIKIIKVTPHER